MGKPADSTVATHSESRTILGIALPLTLAYVAEMGMVITDMVIVGRLGSVELAAVGLAGDLFWVFLLIGMGIVAIVGVFAAQALGAGDLEAVKASGEQGFVAALITSVPIILLTWFLGPMLSYADQDPAVVVLISEYAHMLTLAVVPALIFFALRNYVMALAASAVIGWITVGALVLNLGLNYTLVYGKLGLPALGVAGAGLGTAIVNWAMLATIIIYLRRSPAFEGKRPTLPPRSVDRAGLKELFRLGLPVAGTQMLAGGMFSAAAVLVGIISASALAAQQILYSVVYLALSAAGGFADAVRVRVAYGVGRGDLPASRHSSNIALAMTAVATLAATLVIWLAPEALVAIFLDTDTADSREVLAIALSVSGVAGLFLLMDGIQIVAADAIRGLRDTRSPFWISLGGYWVVGIGAAAALCFPLGYGIHGLWWGLVLGVALCAVLLWVRLRQLFASMTLGQAT